MLRYVTISKFAELSGYTQVAIRSKIRDGIWRKDMEWRKAPDGRVLIDVDGYHRWVDSEPALKLARRTAPRSKSPSPLR